MNRNVKDPRHRTQALFGQLEKVSLQIVAKPTPEAVHQLRTTIRRVETLIATNPTGKKYSRLLKQLKTLRRPGGRVRDVDVQLLALRGIQTGHKREKMEVRRTLEQLRKKRSRKLVKAVEAEIDSGVGRRLKQTGAALIADESFSSPHVHAGMLLAALDKFASLIAQYPPLREDNLHDFRMKCKRIRYLAEMEGGRTASQQAVSQFVRIQDAIGEWHDWVNLAQTTQDVLASPNSPLLAAVRAGRQAKFNEALRITSDAKARLLDLRTASTPHAVRAAAPGPILFKMQVAG